MIDINVNIRPIWIDWLIVILNPNNGSIHILAMKLMKNPITTFAIDSINEFNLFCIIIHL